MTYINQFLFEKNSNLVSRAVHDYIVQCLQSSWWKPNRKDWTLDEQRFSKMYRLHGNTKGRCLRRLGVGNAKEWLLVPTFEIMFYTHDKLSHTWTVWKNKLSLNTVWYGIPEERLCIFWNTCPYCMSARNPTVPSRMQPLKFIMRPTVGHRAQVDLISMESMSIQGYKYKMWYVDHLSGSSHVAIMKSKKGEEAGAKLI